ncbi:MAG TPA: Hint domain-containing protein [Dehalococcoidales bacterium]
MAAVLVGLMACGSGPATTTTPTVSTTPTPTISTTPTIAGPYNQNQLEYLLLAKYPDYFWCDPDFYPIAREGQEQANAIAQFPTIQANATEFTAILDHLVLAVKTDYTDPEKLIIYREYKVLNGAITMIPTPGISAGYAFSLRTGQNQGLHIAGNINTAGQITITTQETSFNTCPICLTRGTLIDTPTGQIPVEQLQRGMPVWTTDTAGLRIAATIIKTSSTPVPPSFQVLKITLADGRTLTASPGHPTAELRPLSDYGVGDILDDSRIVEKQSIEYFAGATFDLLPSGETGLYWANGILLASTLPK